MISIRHRNRLAKDFFLAIEVDFEKKIWWGVGKGGEMIGIMRVCVLLLSLLQICVGYGASETYCA